MKKKYRVEIDAKHHSIDIVYKLGQKGEGELSRTHTIYSLKVPFSELLSLIKKAFGKRYNPKKILLTCSRPTDGELLMSIRLEKRDFFFVQNDPEGPLVVSLTPQYVSLERIRQLVYSAFPKTKKSKVFIFVRLPFLRYDTPRLELTDEVWG